MFRKSFCMDMSFPKVCEEISEKHRGITKHTFLPPRVSNSEAGATGGQHIEIQ